MTCEETKELLSAFQDRELTVEEMSAVQDHLASCKECAAKSNVITNLSRIVQHWEGVRASNAAKRKILEQAQTVGMDSGRTFGPVALTLLGLLAGMLLAGGGFALYHWYSERSKAETERTTPNGSRAAVECTDVVNRVELVGTDGARIDVRGRTQLAVGQELFCDNGSAAQMVLRSTKPPSALVLRGPGSIRLSRNDIILKGGTLVFRVSSAGGAERAPLTVSVGLWTITVPGSAVGLVELSRDGNVRVEVSGGEVTLAGTGSSATKKITAGQSLAIDAGGVMTPKEITDQKAFDLLAPLVDQ